jgi:hypothetical protein
LRASVDHTEARYARVTRAANDKQRAVPMGRAALENVEAAGIERPKAADGTVVPIPNTAHTGYFSAEAIRGLEQIGLDPYIAVERPKHHQAVSDSEPTAATAAIRGRIGALRHRAPGSAHDRDGPTCWSR